MKNEKNMRNASTRASFAALLALLIGMGSLHAQVPKDKTDIRIDSLLSLMSLEEKIGQMTLFTSDWELTGPNLRAEYRADIQKGRVGAIFNAHTAAFTRELQRMAVEETRLGIPLLFGYDVVHGYKTIFPIPLGAAASWDLTAIEGAARIAAAEATASGLHWTFAPMVDIARDPRWGRVAEGAGEDPFLGAAVARAQVRGFQGENMSDPSTLLACVKHFAAYGAAQAGRDYHAVDISERVLREVYLPPFKAALDAGARTFMTSFNDFDGVPATGNAHLLTDILKEEWAFDGFVVTDYTSINEMVPHGVAANDKEAAELAANAGVDMDMQGAVFMNHLASLVKEGRVEEAKIDDAVRRILRQKIALGLFEDPYRYSDENREKAVVFSEANRAQARDLARKSMVLLKNEGQVLPLDPRSKTLALIGPLADNGPEMIGSWSAAGAPGECVSLLTGLREQAKGAEILYAKGCEIDSDDRSGFAAAIAAASRADVIVFAAGEAALMSGEAASRSMPGLPGVQQELMLELVKTGKPVVVVLMNGRPLILSDIDEPVAAMLEAWFPGTEGGRAIADVLFGVYNPSGKLPMTFPRNVGQIPIFYNMKNTGRPFDANNKYTSKYLDVSNEPLYPFGFGLSYTTFRYSDPVASAATFGRNDSLQIRVTLTNTGSRAGEEVVQLYISDVAASVTRPVKELRGFQKISLAPGASKEVIFALRASDLAFYDRNMQYRAEAGEFRIFVGGSSSVANSILVRLEK